MFQLVLTPCSPDCGTLTMDPGEFAFLVDRGVDRHELLQFSARSSPSAASYQHTAHQGL
ncbi:hypothetical protein I547_6466 [Mycobacterium kansasii 824]|nr:hypothetical protein I547_6466 [Mycobacterium kansasii 824]OOK66632.1 hypothetical protein BZL30_8319 [Mycobacterium kansasii]